MSCLVTVPGSVCATKGGQNFTYFNTCYAAKDQATAAKSGACKEARHSRWQEEKGLINIVPMQTGRCMQRPVRFQNPNLFLARRNLQQLANLFFR